LKGSPQIFSGLIGLLLGVMLGVGGLTLFNRQRPAPIEIVAPPPPATTVPTATPGPIRVFVSGEVVSPAVYELPPDAILEEAVAAAGGFTPQAETAVVNLALPLQDGMHIFVPAVGEATPVPVPVVTLAEEAPEKGAAGAGSRVDINLATQEELDSLPGIGPSTAEKIIAYREANGRFTTIDEIMNVSGIGPAKFDQIKDLIVVEGE